MRPTQSTALILPPCILLLLGLAVWLLPRPVSEAANNTNPCTSVWSDWKWDVGPPTLTSTVSSYKKKIALQIPPEGDDSKDLPTAVSVGVAVTANSATRSRTDSGCGGSETETVTPSPETTWTVSGGDAEPGSGSGTSASFDVKSPGSVTVTFSTVDTTGEAASVSSSATMEILRIPRLRFSQYVPEERLSKLPPIYVNHFDANNNERWDSLESATPDPRALTPVELSVESVSGFTATATVAAPAGVKLWADPQKTKLFAPANVELGEKKTFYVEGLQRTNSNDALEFTANWQEGEFRYSTRGKTGVWEVDIDVDSRNTKGFGAPAPDDQAEDEVEFSQKKEFPGKVVVINTKFADGLGLSGAGTASPQLVPMVLRLNPLRNEANATFQLDYRASRPGLAPAGDIVDKGAAAGSDRYSLSAGGMRIWKSAGRNPKKITEGGDYIPSGEEIAWDRLGSGDTATVYVEYVDNSPASAGGKSAVTFTAKEARAALDDATEVSSTDSVNMFLLPFELRDIKGAGTSDDVVIQAQGTQQTDYTGKSIAWIEPELANGGPQMPQLEARLAGAESMTSLNVEWKVEIKYDRGNGSRTSRNQAEDTVKIPASGFVTKPASEVWKIYQESDWTTEISNNGFFGGDAILTMKISGQAEQKFYFRIGGKNPSDAAGRSFIDGESNSNERFSYAIAKHETAEYRYNGSLYNQFRSKPSSGKVGLPTWNNDGSNLPGGYGIYQITGTPTDSEANIQRRQIWNWQDNVRAYFAIIRHPIKSELATRFYNDIKHDSPQHEAAFNAHPPPDIPVGSHTFPSSEAIWIASYNGWAGTVKSRYIFDPSKPPGLGATKMWYWHPPNNPDEPYINKVERQLNP